MATTLLVLVVYYTVRRTAPTPDPVSPPLQWVRPLLVDLQSPPTGLWCLQELATLASRHQLHARAPPAPQLQHDQVARSVMADATTSRTPAQAHGAREMAVTGP